MVRIVVMTIVGLIGAVIIAFLFGYFVMLLWNWLLPPLLHAGTINYWQAFGIVILAKILFGGIGGAHRTYGSRRWRRKAGVGTAGNRGAGLWAGKVTIPKIDLTINDGQLKVADSTGQKTEISQINCKINLQSPPQQTDFDINFSVAGPKQQSRIFAKGQITPAFNRQGFSIEKTKADFTINLADLDLKSFEPLATLFGLLPASTQIEGVLNSAISAQTKDNICRIKVADSRITNLVIIYPNQKPFEQSTVTFGLNAELNGPDQSLKVDNSYLLSPQIKIQNASFAYQTKNNTAKIRGQFDYEYDWQTVKTLAGPAWPAELQIEGQRKDTLAFSSEYPAGQTGKILSNLTAKTKTGFLKAQYSGLMLGATEPNIAAENGLLKITPFSTSLNSGLLNFAASIDLNSKPPTLTLPAPVQIVKDFQLNDIISNKLLPYINPIFQNAFNVSGRANLYCESLSTPLSADNLNDIEIAGTFSVDNLQIQTSDLLGQILEATGKSAPSQNLTVRPVKFVLKNGILKYDNMQIDIGNISINFLNASIGLDKSCDMTIELPLSIGGKVVKSDKILPGNRIKIRIKAGPGEKPKLDLKPFIEDQVQNLIENQLQKVLQQKTKK